MAHKNSIFDMCWIKWEGVLLKLDKWLPRKPKELSLLLRKLRKTRKVPSLELRKLK
ncbi:unnamed protein product [Rhodiola kirilowii]